MNNQVLIDRELLKELASFCSDSRSYNEAMRVLAATHAPIHDTGEGVDFWWADEPLSSRALVMKVADHNRIVSALQADHIEHVRAMVVPDGWQLVPVDPAIEMIAAIGFDGDVELAIGHAAISAQCVETYRNLLAASPAPGDSQ